MMPPEIRALVVEDDASWQQILSEILADAGSIVDVAANLEQAIQLLKSKSHRVAVIDLSLTGNDHTNNDGLSVLKAARLVDPGCQSILLTGFSTVELAVSVLTEYGAFSFLRKETFQRRQFHELIQRALACPPASKELLVELKTHSTNEFNDARNSSKALVVEDDAGWRNILAELLTDALFIVQQCASLGEAIGCLRREQYELAVIDLSLTGEGYWDQGQAAWSREGYELLALTRSAGIPTVVVSGIASVDEIKRAYQDLSIYTFIQKQTFDRGAFKRLVDEVRHLPPPVKELDTLTFREREVIVLLARGMTNKEIAASLVITTNTVKRHIKSIFTKLDVHTRSAAAAKVESRPI